MLIPSLFLIVLMINCQKQKEPVLVSTDIETENDQLDIEGVLITIDPKEKRFVYDKRFSVFTEPDFKSSEKGFLLQESDVFYIVKEYNRGKNSHSWWYIECAKGEGWCYDLEDYMETEDYRYERISISKKITGSWITDDYVLFYFGNDDDRTFYFEHGMLGDKGTWKYFNGRIRIEFGSNLLYEHDDYDIGRIDNTTLILTSYARYQSTEYLDETLRFRRWVPGD